MTDLERAIDDRPYTDLIIATIAWFDLFDYPLTAWEAGKWRIDLGRGRVHASRGEGRACATPADVSYIDVLTTLQNLVNKNILVSKWSFFFLPGREKIAETRRLRYMLAREKFARARRVAQWFRCVPFVRLAAVCNTLGYSNAAEGSDIDFFVVTAPGKIWTVRALCLMLLQLFRLRPLLVRFGAVREARKDKIDLSFFIAEDSLDISTLTLPYDESRITNHELWDTNSKTVIPDSKFLIRDPYLTYWLVQLTPLWDHGDRYRRLWMANETLRAPLPLAAPYTHSTLRAVASSWSVKRLQKLLELIFSGGWIEKAIRSFQMQKMPARIRQLAGASDGVVVADAVLKFHDIDRRREYRERWCNKLKDLLGSVIS